MNDFLDKAEQSIMDTLRERGDNLYTDMARKSDAGICAINKFMFTYAILSDLTEFGYEKRWCYSTFEGAKAAFDAWEGKDGTEPQGWKKDTMTGRRRDENTGADLGTW